MEFDFVMVGGHRRYQVICCRGMMGLVRERGEYKVCDEEGWSRGHWGCG
jgi:hypothetical protein